MSKYLIVLISVFLTACSTVPKEVIVQDVKTTDRSIPEQLLRKEPVPVPVDRTKYVNYPVLKDRACKSPIDQPQLS